LERVRLVRVAGPGVKPDRRFAPLGALSLPSRFLPGLAGLARLPAFSRILFAMRTLSLAASVLCFFCWLGRAGAQSPPRGRIVDRHGEVMARTGSGSQIRFIPPGADLSKEAAEAALAEYQKVLGRSSGMSSEVLQRLVSGANGQPVSIASAPTAEEEAAVRAAKLPAWDVATWHRREYPGKTLAANLLGYVTTRLVEEGELVGRSGLEKRFDADLTKGRTLVTSLDLSLQRDLEKMLADLDRPGAIVVTDARSAELLAMVSWPTFDPNQFIPAISARAFTALRDDIRHPLLDRTHLSTFTPGYALRPFTAMGAVQAGGFDPNSETETSDLIGAIRRASSVRFSLAARRLDSPKFYDALTAMGFGRRTGFDRSEAEGQIVFAHQPDATLTHVNVLIGQGAVNVTPLQLARAMVALVNGGALMHLRPALRLLAPDGGVHEEFPAAKERDLPFPEKGRQAILQGMRDSVSSPEGTTRTAATPGWSVAGVTGSAEYRRRVEDESVTLTRGTFVGFAPFENPRYVVVVALEECTGGKDAATLAGRIFKLLQEKK
jgi:penicillin-binding protein 2